MLFGYLSCGLHYLVAHSSAITHAHALTVTLFYFHTEMYLFGEDICCTNAQLSKQYVLN